MTSSAPGAGSYLGPAARARVAIVEANKAGSTLTGVERQSAKYTAGLPTNVPAPDEAAGVRLRVDRREDASSTPRGVKANVLFFDRKPASETPWTKSLWVYDLRTNQHFTLRENPLPDEHLDDFVTVYAAGNRAKRNESERFRRFSYDELIGRDKASLDLLWLRDEPLEDTDNLPAPEAIAAEIVEDLEAALAKVRRDRRIAVVAIERRRDGRVAVGS